MPSFSSFEGLQSAVSKVIEDAIESTAEIAVGTLQSIIQKSFYDQYSPIEYERTEQFLRSATAEYLEHNFWVFIDEDAMSYNTIDGYEQTILAASGYHGLRRIQTSGRFWEEYLKWANKYLVNIFLEQLSLRGLHTNAKPIF